MDTWPAELFENDRVSFRPRCVVIDLILILFAAYAGLGLVVGLALAFAGINRVDPAAADSPWYFRLMVLPGLAGLWPVMLAKWARAGKRGDA